MHEQIAEDMQLYHTNHNDQCQMKDEDYPGCAYERTFQFSSWRGVYDGVHAFAYSGIRIASTATHVQS